MNSLVDPFRKHVAYLLILTSPWSNSWSLEWILQKDAHQEWYQIRGLLVSRLLREAEKIKYYIRTETETAWTIWRQEVINRLLLGPWKASCAGDIDHADLFLAVIKGQLTPDFAHAFDSSVVNPIRVCFFFSAPHTVVLLVLIMGAIMDNGAAPLVVPGKVQADETREPWTGTQTPPHGPHWKLNCTRTGILKRWQNLEKLIIQWGRPSWQCAGDWRGDRRTTDSKWPISLYCNQLASTAVNAWWWCRYLSRYRKKLLTS